MAARFYGLTDPLVLIRVAGDEAAITIVDSKQNTLGCDEFRKLIQCVRRATRFGCSDPEGSRISLG